MTRVLFAVLVCVLSLPAQTWDSVRNLQPGQPVRILDTSGEEHKGKLKEITPDSISIEHGKRAETVERAHVRRVKVRSGGRRVRNTLIGAGAGLAVGLVFDNTAGVYVRNELNETSAARALTYVAPTAIFALIGAVTPAYKTVYKAK